MTVSVVVGAGYVGGLLARKLAENRHQVYAVTRSGVEIEDVESIETDVTKTSEVEIPDCDNLFYLVSAGGRDTESYRESYVTGLRNVSNNVDGDTDLYYTSSTGVYGEMEGEVDEETSLALDTPRSRVLREAEEVALGNDGTVVRFAGIYGPERHGVDRYLGDTQVKNGYLNLIHRHDAAESLRHLSSIQTQHSLYIACDDEPVERHQLARWLSDKTGRPHGELVDETKQTNKRCNNRRLRKTGWELRYPSFREGYSEILEKME